MHVWDAMMMYEFANLTRVAHLGCYNEPIHTGNSKADTVPLQVAEDPAGVNGGFKWK
jgi:hypothetical protein